MIEPVQDLYATWDAAYVLGSLSPAERREYEQHKAQCAGCSAAVHELAGMPALLSGLKLAGLDEAGLARDQLPADAKPPATLVADLTGQVRRRRWRNRFATAAALTTAACLAVVSVYLWAPRRTVQLPPAVALAQVVPSPLHADIRLRSESWGTMIEVTCSYEAATGAQQDWAPQKRNYSLFVVDRQNHDMLAGTWYASPGGVVTPASSTSLALAQISRVQVRSDTGAVLLELRR